MEEVRASVQPQPSICSDSNGEENHRPDDRRLCLVGPLAYDPDLKSIAESFKVPVVCSKDGNEYVQSEPGSRTVFVLESFESEAYDRLYFKSRQSLLGPPALRQLAVKGDELPDNTRPLYNLAMAGVVVAFTGFRDKEELSKLVPLIHHMGGSIRKEMSSRVTHLIANTCGGDKYQYAVTFRLPVMNYDWVHASWAHKDELNFSATQDTFMAQYKLKPFHGANVCFVGFPEEEKKHMTEVLVSNGGSVATLDDPSCTHVVMEHAEVYTLEAANAPVPSPPTRPFHPSKSDLPRTPGGKALEVSQTPVKQVPRTPVHTPCNIASNPFQQSFADLETVHEDLNMSGQSSCRKRKFLSPGRERSYSEKKRKVSNFFKTPMKYLSNRRRTIQGGQSFVDKNLDESVASTPGLFSIDTMRDLSYYEDAPADTSKIRKSLFSRTFRRSKKGPKMSLCEPNDAKMNASCFPDISLNPTNTTTNTTIITNTGRTTNGTTPAAAAVAAVVDEAKVGEKPEVAQKVYVVKAEWFWTSVQKEVSLVEKEYLFDDYVEQVLSPSGRRDSHTVTPSSASRRKRKRIQETLSSLVQTQSPSLHKRRSSVDAGLLSISGSFLDSSMPSPSPKEIHDGAEPIADTPRKGLTPRHQVFLELLQTETNYVDILHTIMTMFKKHLEEMPEEEALLNNTELNLIFGKLPPIYETHVKMLDEFRWTSAHWTEEKSIGNIIVKYSTELLKAYPPFINYFEEMKEMLAQCDQNKPRFHAFLKACQTKPECGRQSLQELMIRPVQRLGSISLLLNDILKNTQKTNPDHAALAQALAALREVMTHINEDKKKTEGQVTLFNIFNDIDNCPPDIVSSHRSFITRSEVVQVSSSEGLASKGSNLVLYLFSDQLEVCKKKSKAFNTLKSPSTTAGSLQNRQSMKPYKHVKLMPLNTIKRVIDIKETEECQKVFSVICRDNQDVKDRLHSFSLADETDKTSFLKLLTRTMADNSCTADAEKFLAYVEPETLDINTSDLGGGNGTLSKAFRFATTRVGRAFSFNKTPSKLKRAVSSMMSPFGGSATNIARTATASLPEGAATPASVRGPPVKLASFSDLNDAGNLDRGRERIE